MNVGLLRIFPGIQLATIVANLQAPLRGVVLQTYGAGNIPERPEVLAALAEATRRGVIIVNCSQCVHGDVTAAYRAGKVRSGPPTVGCPGDQTASRALQPFRANSACTTRASSRART